MIKPRQETSKLYGVRSMMYKSHSNSKAFHLTTKTLLCLSFLLFHFSLSTLKAQEKKDTVPVFLADSLNTVYIFADTEMTFNKTDKQGRKQGLWKKFYTDGKVRYKGHFIDNKPVGIFKNYYDNDSLQSIRVFSDDGINAGIHIFYPTGALESEGKTVNEKDDSIWKYYDEMQRLILKQQFKKGVLDGKCVTFYANGNTAEIKTYKDGKQNGPWEQFFDDGELKLESNYQNGMRQDTLYAYIPGGLLHIKGKYVNDFKEGSWIYYDAGGLPKDTVEYHLSKFLHPEKYRMTKQQEDSIKIQNQPLQNELENPGSLDDESKMGNDGR